jgi:hypothetical protein
LTAFPWANLEVLPDHITVGGNAPGAEAEERVTDLLDDFPEVGNATRQIQ